MLASLVNGMVNLLQRLSAAFGGSARAVAPGLLVVSVGLCAGGCAFEPRFPPNVVLISVDTLRADALPRPQQGDQNLPHLQRLADRSRAFERAMSAAPWTLPSHASLFTGLYPDRHGATDRRLRLPEDLPTLAEALRNEGYRTVAFTDGGYLRREYGLDRGFERYDEHDAESDLNLELPQGGATPAERGRSHFARALAFLEQRDPTAPFFLFLHTYAVHDYYWLHPWVVQLLESPPTRRAQEYADCVIGKRHCNEEDWELLRDLYRYEVENLDRGVGRLVEALERLNLSDNTIIVLVSDHGEGFEPEVERIGHGGRVDPDQLRVPLWFHGPGILPGRSPEAVSLVDVKPTLLELVGREPPESLDGESLVPALKGTALDSPRALLAMEHYYGWQNGVRYARESVEGDPLSAAVIQFPWYFTTHETRGRELLTVDADPELPVLTNDQTLSDLEGTLVERMATYTPPRRPSLEDPRLTEELRALGYIE